MRIEPRMIQRNQKTTLIRIEPQPIHTTSVKTHLTQTIIIQLLLVQRKIEVIIMAQPQKKNFMSPPIFRGTANEDAQDWLERYEATAKLNHWRETEETLENFGFYLDGAARQWYLCSVKPNHFQDTLPVPTQGGNDPVPAIPGLRSSHMREFEHELTHMFFLKRKSYGIAFRENTRKPQHTIMMLWAYADKWIRP